MAERAAKRREITEAERRRIDDENEAAEDAERERRIAEGLPGPVDWPGHETHHWHVRYLANYRTCSCGGDVPSGCWTVGMDDARYWSDDPAEVAQAQREDDDFRAWVTCRHCGETGVTADDVFGTWPPRTLEGLAHPLELPRQLKRPDRQGACPYVVPGAPGSRVRAHRAAFPPRRPAGRQQQRAAGRHRDEQAEEHEDREDFQGACQPWTPRSAAHVLGPTIPSTPVPDAACRARTALSVAPPNDPSMPSRCGPVVPRS